MVNSDSVDSNEEENEHSKIDTIPDSPRSTSPTWNSGAYVQDSELEITAGTYKQKVECNIKNGDSDIIKLIYDGHYGDIQPVIAVLERENRLNEKFSIQSEEVKSTKTNAPHESKRDQSNDLNKHNLPSSSLQCSVPLVKLHIDSANSTVTFKNEDGREDENISKLVKRISCLYCERTFSNYSLQQKHVDRCHLSGHSRRSSSRTHTSTQSSAVCFYCRRFRKINYTLDQLFEHLVIEHSKSYYGCLECKERFVSQKSLAEHNRNIHRVDLRNENKTLTANLIANVTHKCVKRNKDSNGSLRTQTVVSCKSITSWTSKNTAEVENIVPDKKIKQVYKKFSSSTGMTLRNRLRNRIHVRSTKLNGKNNVRTTRSIAKKLAVNAKSVLRKERKEKEILASRQIDSTLNFYSAIDALRVRKRQDHSIDTIKSSMIFDDVFDSEFYKRTVRNIRENLLHYIDGKLNTNTESENRISSFEYAGKNNKCDNFGCDITLSAVTPVATLLSSSHFVDFESHIEYGSKASKKKNKCSNVKYKYDKYMSQNYKKEDQIELSKFDMWTQLAVKNRQQMIIDSQKTADEKYKESFEDAYKAKLQVEELNRILDRRPPFEDLRLEASKLKYKHSKFNEVEHEVKLLLDDVVNDVFKKVEECEVVLIKSDSYTEPEQIDNTANLSIFDDNINSDIPDYLQLQRRSAVKEEPAIDKSDRITLICSSQECNYFDDIPQTYVELSGEWTRPRLYICATCGIRLYNLKSLEDHKNFTHPHIWCAHYEFVGRQSSMYKHLSIPGLGKIGELDKSGFIKVWQRSDARLCAKCSKVCNTSSELHKHMLECGGDWTWMFARKKCKYKPYGSKSRRRKRRGYFGQFSDDEERPPRPRRKYNIKPKLVGPRSKPSDADSIQRMLANLPPKRISRKIISLHEGLQRRKYTKRNIIAPNKSVIKVVNKAQKRKQFKNKVCERRVTRQAPEEVKAKEVKSIPDEIVQKKRTFKRLGKVISNKIIDSSAGLRKKRKILQTIQTRRTRLSTGTISDDDGIKKPPENVPKVSKISKQNSISERDKTLANSKIEIKINNLETKTELKLCKNISKRKNSSVSNNCDKNEIPQMTVIEAELEKQKKKPSTLKLTNRKAVKTKSESYKSTCEIKDPDVNVAGVVFNNETELPKTEKSVISSLMSKVTSKASKKSLFSRTKTRKKCLNILKWNLRSDLTKNEIAVSEKSYPKTTTETSKKGEVAPKLNKIIKQKPTFKRNTRSVSSNITETIEAVIKNYSEEEEKLCVDVNICEEANLKVVKRRKWKVDLISKDTVDTKVTEKEVLSDEVNLIKSNLKLPLNKHDKVEVTAKVETKKDSSRKRRKFDLKTVFKKVKLRQISKPAKRKLKKNKTENKPKGDEFASMPTLEKFEPVAETSVNFTDCVPILEPIHLLPELICEPEEEIKIIEETTTAETIVQSDVTKVEVVSENTPVVTNSVSDIKHKRKPSRRLNDCIAMLTCKLQQKLNEESKNEFSNKPTDDNKSENSKPQDSDNIVFNSNKENTLGISLHENPFRYMGLQSSHSNDVNKEKLENRQVSDRGIIFKNIFQTEQKQISTVQGTNTELKSHLNQLDNNRFANGESVNKDRIGTIIDLYNARNKEFQNDTIKHKKHSKKRDLKKLDIEYLNDKFTRKQQKKLKKLFSKLNKNILFNDDEFDKNESKKKKVKNLNNADANVLHFADETVIDISSFINNSLKKAKHKSKKKHKNELKSQNFELEANHKSKIVPFDNIEPDKIVLSGDILNVLDQKNKKLTNDVHLENEEKLNEDCISTKYKKLSERIDEINANIDVLIRNNEINVPIKKKERKLKERKIGTPRIKKLRKNIIRSVETKITDLQQNCVNAASQSDTDTSEDIPLIKFVNTNVSQSVDNNCTEVAVKEIEFSSAKVNSPVTENLQGTFEIPLHGYKPENIIDLYQKHCDQIENTEVPNLNLPEVKTLKKRLSGKIKHKGSSSSDGLPLSKSSEVKTKRIQKSKKCVLKEKDDSKIIEEKNYSELRQHLSEEEKRNDETLYLKDVLNIPDEHSFCLNTDYSLATTNTFLVDQTNLDDRSVHMSKTNSEICKEPKNSIQSDNTKLEVYEPITYKMNYNFIDGILKESALLKQSLLTESQAVHMENSDVSNFNISIIDNTEERIPVIDQKAENVLHFSTPAENENVFQMEAASNDNCVISDEQVKEDLSATSKTKNHQNNGKRRISDIDILTKIEEQMMGQHIQISDSEEEIPLAFLAKAGYDGSSENIRKSKKEVKMPGKGKKSKRKIQPAYKPSTLFKPKQKQKARKRTEANVSPIDWPVTSINDTLMESAKNLTLNHVEQYYSNTVNQLETSADILYHSKVSENSLDGSSNSKEKKEVAPALDIYCEICCRSFVRPENLAKHKRTLTHIAKLSALEAQMYKNGTVEEVTEDVKDRSQETSETDVKDKDESNYIAATDVTADPDSPTCDPLLTDISSSNSTLKLADIITSALNKPIVDSFEISDFSSTSLRAQRCKSLGERKSFELEIPQSQCEDFLLKSSGIKPVNGILEKQISLLEDIIDKNSSNVDYIEDSERDIENEEVPSSVKERSQEANVHQESVPVRLDDREISFTEDNYSQINKVNECEPESSLKSACVDVPQLIIQTPQVKICDSFLTCSADGTAPLIGSENNSAREAEIGNKENTAVRKTLNHDEELFLECCTLLKSRSEVSDKAKSQLIPSTNLVNSLNDVVWVQSNLFINSQNCLSTRQSQWSNKNYWSNSSSDWISADTDKYQFDWLTSKEQNSNSISKSSDFHFEDISVHSFEENGTLIKTAENIVDCFEKNTTDFHSLNFFDSTKERTEFSDDELQIIEDSRSDINEESTLGCQNENSSDSCKSGCTGVLNLKLSSCESDVHEQRKQLDENSAELNGNSNESESFQEFSKNMITSKEVDTKQESEKCDLMVSTLSSDYMEENCLYKFCENSSNAKTGKVYGYGDYNSGVDDGNDLLVKGNISEINDSTSNSTKNDTGISNGSLKENAIFTFGSSKDELQLVKNKHKRKTATIRKKCRQKVLNHTSDCPKKLMTKGAMKVFDSLKVSIPTDDIDMSEVLNCSSRCREENRKSKKKKLFNNSKNRDKYVLDKIGNELGFREIKKKSGTSKMKNGKRNSIDINDDKPHDIYDFEESQDDIDFPNSSLSLFRSKQAEKIDRSKFDLSNVVGEAVPHISNDNTFDENSTSSTFFNHKQSKKSHEKRGNQKKSLIMERIFKHAAKSKPEDKITEIRDNSSEESSKAMESFLESCSSFNEYPEDVFEYDGVEDSKPLKKLSETEINFLFDQLLDKPAEAKQPENQMKEKKRGKRRVRHNSDNSTDDDFSLSRTRKSTKRLNKSRKEESINLEQEIRECIGVAGRKSQRKCTSGKQNILVEFWSSDESLFEDILSNDCGYNDHMNEKEKTEQINGIIDEITKNEVSISSGPADIENGDSNSVYATTETPEIHVEEPQKTQPKKVNKQKQDRSKVKKQKKSSKEVVTEETIATTRRKRNAAEMLYYWSSSSEDEFQDMIEIKPVRDEDSEDDKPMQHGWIVGDSPKKLVTMLAQAKGKKLEADNVKEQKKSRVTL